MRLNWKKENKCTSDSDAEGTAHPYGRRHVETAKGPLTQN